MNGLIVYPIIILVIIGGFYQIYNLSYINMEYSDTLEAIATEGNQTLDETESTFNQETREAVFNITMTTGLIALIIGLTAVGVIAGIRVLGSGLSDFSVKLIYNSSVYYGLWGIFSSLAFPVFNIIPTLGLFFWLGLTLIYSLGFFHTVSPSGGG